MTEETFTTEEEVVFKVNAKSDETNIKTVKLSYKNNKMNDYETYNLLKEDGDIFSKIISKYDLIGKAYFDYYFEVSDGFKTVKTHIKRITNTDVDTSAIRFNINENTYLSGINNLITTGDNLFIDGEDKTSETEGTPATPSQNSNITTSNENDLDRNSYDFTFAIESDTQYYNEDTSDNTHIVCKYEHQLNIHDWLLANRSRMNIQYLFHDGDIVDDVDMISQWENADAAYKKLDEAVLPYGVLAGNHDVGHLTGDYTNYGTYFGEDRFINNKWYGESYKNNRAHYDLISVDGIDFIMMYVWFYQDIIIMPKL